MLLDICRRIYAYTYIYSCTSALENIYQCKFYIDLDFDEENVQIYSIYAIEDLYVHVGCVWCLVTTLWGLTLLLCVGVCLVLLTVYTKDCYSNTYF